jgi:hypothetical protein
MDLKKNVDRFKTSLWCLLGNAASTSHLIKHCFKQVLIMFVYGELNLFRGLIYGLWYGLWYVLSSVYVWWLLGCRPKLVTLSIVVCVAHDDVLN